MQRLLFISFSFFLLASILTPYSTLANLPTAVQIKSPQEEKIDLLLLLLQRLHNLMGLPRKSPLLHKYLSKDKSIEREGYCYSYPSLCTKVLFDDTDEVCYLTIDHHPDITKYSLSDIEQRFGKPIEKTVRCHEGTYYTYHLTGRTKTIPVLLLFKHNTLVTISLFPSDF